jgi:hypothetical protein
MVKATSKGLKSATLTLRSNPIKIENGYAMSLPVMPTVALPTDRPSVAVDLEQTPVSAQRSDQAGKFITTFSYSGPTTGVHVLEDVRDGMKVLIDRDLSFSALPVMLRGADYIAAAGADARYNAVDLMEIAVKAGSTVFVAHDERLSLPEWLSRQFNPIPLAITLNGHSMRVFQHDARKDESLTLGTNTEDANAPSDSVMYLVFVNGH